MRLAIGILVSVLLVGLIGFVKRKMKYGAACCGEKEEMVERIRAADREASHYPYHYVIWVEGMTCGNCARRVENAFHQTGEALARVDLGTKKVHLRYKRSMDRKEIAKIVDEAGYTLTECEKEE